MSFLDFCFSYYMMLGFALVVWVFDLSVVGLTVVGLFDFLIVWLCLG